MVSVPFPLNSTPGIRPGEGDGRRINAWIDTDGDRQIIRRSPGMVSAISSGQSGIVRGAIRVDSAWYIVFGTTVVREYSGAFTVLAGSIPGTDGITLARNRRTTGGASTPDIVAVRATGGAYVITETTVSAYPSPNLPGTVNSVEFMDGYFHFSIPDGRLFASELNSATVNALSFTTAEARADGLRRVIASGSILYAMGDSTIEPYQNVGTQPYPLQRGATVIPVGVISVMGAIGNDEAWNHPLFFVASDYTVRMLSGYETARISTPDVDRFIQASTTSEIRMMVYVNRGVGFVVVSSNLGSWEYDTTLRSWTERRSLGHDRWRVGATFYDDMWYFVDRMTGDVLRIDPTVWTENGSPIQWVLESGPVKDFPDCIFVPSLFMDFTEADVDMSVDWSHDGGKTWSQPVTRSLSDAEKWPVRVNRLGLSTHHGIRVRMTTSTTGNFAFMGASIPIPDLRPTA